MDDATKQEILVAIHTSQEETGALVATVIADQLTMRAELASFRTELDALKSRGVAWDAADAGHSRAIADGIAEAKRITTDAANASKATLEAAAHRHNELAAAVGNVASELASIKKDIGAQVLEALGAHVHKIEDAADRLTKSPRVRTGAAIAGTFAGSALVTALIEILKHL